MPDIQVIKKSDVSYRHWESSQPKAVLLLVHGLGAHSGRWNFMAEFLRNLGFSSYAIELKGFGETPDLRGHIDSFNIYFKDILKLHNEIKGQKGNIPVFILGESLGGLIAFNLAADNPNLFSGLILIAPAFKSALKFSLMEYIKVFLSLTYNPKKAFNMPFTSAMCTRDHAYQQKMDADPREIRVATSKLLLNSLIEQLRSMFLIKKLSIPALFLLAGKDYLVDPKESKKVFKKLTLKDKTLIDYPEMLHALSIELGRESVFKDIYAWLIKRL